MSSVSDTYHNQCLGKPCRVIESGGKPYLIRVFLEHRYSGRSAQTVYMHRFVSADAERWLHDHPFSARSNVLCGGYAEEILTALSHKRPITKLMWRTPGEDFDISGGTFHRIVSVEPNTWTLFRHGPHLAKGWGFLEWEHDERGSSMRYHQPFPESNGAHWWGDPDCLRYPPPGVL